MMTTSLQRAIPSQSHKEVQYEAHTLFTPSLTAERIRARRLRMVSAAMTKVFKPERVSENLRHPPPRAGRTASGFAGSSSASLHVSPATQDPVKSTSRPNITVASSPWPGRHWTRYSSPRIPSTRGLSAHPRRQAAISGSRASAPRMDSSLATGPCGGQRARDPEAPVERSQLHWRLRRLPQRGHLWHKASSSAT